TYPLSLDGTRTRTTFPADNHPVDGREIAGAHRSDQRLDRKEANARRSFLQMTDATLLAAILDRNTEPHVGRTSALTVASAQKITHQRRPLGKYLERVPVRSLHRVEHVGNECVWYLLVKQIAH